MKCRRIVLLLLVTTLVGLFAPLAALSALAAPPNGKPGGGGQTCTNASPSDDMVVTQTTIFCPGTYKIADRGKPGVIIVGADNITLDGTGMTLEGRNASGYGIYLNGHSGVTIKGFTITSYYYAVRAENASGLLIEGNTVSGNKITDNTFLNINQSLASASGGGILFNQVTRSTVRANTGNRQDVGVNLYESDGNTIANNDFSHNKAWGIRLFKSSSNTLDANQAHHVNRCNNSGCDSAGILVTNDSNYNVVTNNTLTYSGDGFFIGNQHSLPSNHNRIEGNDG
ncbi:MAG TPA: right-handed parallel beta-helix repeat-containing protein, partial [Herpetosiphonaceae bacterium]|nr:right-handed parallel beta-helix repeat-containing protein [Herpetosiphonaceae bacterium]